MKKEIIYQKNYIFFCSVILPFIQSFDFLLAVTKSLERPVKKLIPNHSPVGCLIISNHIEKKGLKLFY